MKHTLGSVSIKTHYTISIHRGLPAPEASHAHGSALGDRLYINTNCQFTVRANIKSVRPRKHVYSVTWQYLGACVWGSVYLVLDTISLLTNAASYYRQIGKKTITVRHVGYKELNNSKNFLEHHAGKKELQCMKSA